MTSPSDLAAAHLRSLHAYTPGTQPTGGGWIKLNTNELPYPTSARVAPAIQQELDRLPRYPNPTSAPLRAAVAKLHNLQPNQVIIGNGSDDVLNLLIRAFGGADSGVGQTHPSYSLYPVLTAIANGRLETIPFERDMVLQTGELAKLPVSILMLTSPNAPTGIGFRTAQLEQLAASFPGILVIDEAYADFAEENAVSLLSRYERVVITRTFSKSYGLAGLRVGYALASPDVIGILDRIRDSYNVNRLSQAGALAALEDREWLNSVVLQVCDTRDRFRNELLRLGWEVYPSQANFVFARPVKSSGQRGDKTAADLFRHLEAHKILVRYFPGSPLTADGLRISIGTDTDMNRLLEVILIWQIQE